VEIPHMQIVLPDGIGLRHVAEETEVTARDRKTA
jgi:hypothetical protein